MPESEAITHGIRVHVRSTYVAERSEPENDEWFFAYTILITNESNDTVQLLSRHWFITDSDGEVQQVKGPGVVGQQPILGSGESFEYTSACPLTTSFGTMHGTYQMTKNTGDAFDVDIAPFALGEEYSIN